jgi:hypothetical protein
VIAVQDGWREKLIDIDVSEKTPFHFKAVLSKGETPALRVHMKHFDGLEVSSALLSSTLQFCFKMIFLVEQSIYNLIHAVDHLGSKRSI